MNTYTVKASYAGGPTEVIETGLDHAEAIMAVQEKLAERGWDAWMEREV